jgi:mannan endo-1,4-beta-mannosidase
VGASVDPYDRYYPGSDVVDVLATDVYSNQFADRDYVALLKLAGGKPIALGEVGSIPLVRLLRKQPRWTWFMYWHDPFTLHPEAKRVCEVYRSHETLTLDQLPWVKGTKPKIHHPVLR